MEYNRSRDPQHLLTFSHCASGALRADAQGEAEKEDDEWEGCRAEIRVFEETVEENGGQVSCNYKRDGGEEH